MAQAQASEKFILSESRRLRLFTFFLFYFAQGLPLGLLVVAVPAWVAINGGSSGEVASLVAAAYFPWSWKFIVAALMDRYSYLPMGRRRAWLILAQVLMSAGFITAAVLAPGAGDVDALIIVTLVISTGAATQDIAVDGLAVDYLPEKEQGTASAFMFGGQYVGNGLAAAASGFGLALLGPATTFLLFIPVLMLPTIFAMVLRENRGEKRFPWSEGTASERVLAVHRGAWWGRDGLLLVTLRSLLRGSSLWYVICQSIWRTGEGILLPMWPLLAATFLAMSTEFYTSMVSTITLISALVALGLGSLLTAWLGPQRALIACIAAYGALLVFLLLGEQWWTNYAGFIGITACWLLLTVLSSICSNPLRMQLSDKRASATQFTIYNSIANLPVSVGALIFAALGGIEAHQQALLGALAIFTLAGVGFALLRMPQAADPEADPLAQPQPDPRPA